MSPFVARLVRPIAVVLLFAGCTSGAHAADSRSFIIPPSDGYGVAECLAKTGDCGRVVADSWCESYGFAKATSYGPAEDVTSAIAVAQETHHAEPGSFVITCAD